MSSVKSFRDLIVWQKSHAAAMLILRLAKKADYRSPIYEIWRQIIRSAFSVPSNIVEGFSSHKGKTYISHLEVSKGSKAETEYWLIVLLESGEITEADFAILSDQYVEISKMLAVTIRSLVSRTNH